MTQPPNQTPPQASSSALTVAVTGATGFLGRHMISCLQEAGHHVKALTRRLQTGHVGSQVTWITGDLNTPEALDALVNGADVVVHAAGAIKALSRAGFFQVNRDGTRAVAEAAQRRGVEKFVLVSSLAAREPALSPYAASKRAGELVLDEYDKAFDAVILRPPAIYGPGDQETARLFQMAVNGFVAVPRDPTMRVSMIHVRDVATAVLACCGTRQVGGVPFEIDDGSEKGHAWDDLAAAAGASVGRSVKIIRVPDMCLWVGGFCGTIKGLTTRSPAMLTLAKVPELLHSDWVAAGPVPVGWVPKYTLKTGFEDAVHWYSSQNVLKRYL